MFDEENLVFILKSKGFRNVRLREFDPSLDMPERDIESIYAKPKSDRSASALSLFPANLTPIPAPSRANFMTQQSDEVPQHDSQGGFRAAHISEIQFALFYLSLHGLGVLNYHNDKISGEHICCGHGCRGRSAGRSSFFFDVGANVGHYSEMMLECFPTAFVHAFEPHPRNYSHLLQHAFQPTAPSAITSPLVSAAVR